MFVGGLLMIQPGLVTDLVGFLLLAFVLFFQQRRSKAEASSLG
ncbi:MAG: FxsA family protein [Selenomonas sp.]